MPIAPTIAKDLLLTRSQMPPQPEQRWWGFRVIIDPEEKESKLVVDDDEVLSQTVGRIHGPGFFGSNGLPVGNWILTEVLARGTHLWDRTVFDAQGPLATKMQAVDFEPGTNNDDGTFCLFAGYSPYVLGFVFAFPPERNVNLDEVRYDDSVTTLQLRKSPSEAIVGVNTILHHALTIPKNFAAFKKLLITKDWQVTFAGGDIDSERAQDLAVQSWCSLQQGHAPVVIARVQPRLASTIPNNGMPSLITREDPNMAWAPTNRVWGEVLPKAQRNMFGRQGSRAGFAHKVPYMSNLTYPPELYRKLTEFAREYPYDKFNAKAMLFAVQLWVDITSHPKRMTEDFAKNQNDVPEVYLAVFLVYYEAWLKTHEYLQCIQYVHPFRAMRKMHLQDLAASGGGGEVFCVKHTVLKEADIRVLALPSFYSQAARAYKRLIAIPAPIARLSFHGIEIDVQPEALTQCCNLAGQGPTSQLGTQRTFGNVWTHEFQADVDLTTLYQREFALMPFLNPNLPPSYFINSSLLTVWFQKLSRRLAWLNKLGAQGKMELTAGPDGLPIFEGMPLEGAEHLLPPNSTANAIVMALRDPRNIPLLSEPLLTTQYLENIINVLKHRPILRTHVAWQRALTELQEKSRRGAHMKALAVLEILESAKDSYMEDLAATWRRQTTRRYSTIKLQQQAG
ncbi:hypothetical protein QQX98_002090 [Neonectria punicea]|uniref:Uncharacterized protein n=1 Tax=Neonectria punicea TaxID=979145 RepID=A0ABR1HLM3_9HYPO